ncbi:pectin lyase fold/virulence factor [Xylariales sp. PMI_506]|nr:pectin lyase fold/virulence factor [Xylariales sp. PMI_506]
MGIKHTLCRGLVLAATYLGAANANKGVTEGSSIQAAIDAAKPGSKIIVDAGTYYEQLTISKNGIKLRGKEGAILLPPTTPPATSNDCAGLAGNDTVAGICIIGTGIGFEPFVTEHRKVTGVGSYVEGVSVKGFDIRGFVGLNIAIVGAKDTHIWGNTVEDGTNYGILTVGSKNTHISDNIVKSSSLPFIAICMDDQSDVKVTKNSISDYGIGLCIQTNGAEVTHNNVTNCCFGAFVDPGVDGATVEYNSIGPSNPYCNPYFGGFAAGIIVAGAVNADVHHNTVFGTTDNGNPNNTAAGILVYDDPGTGDVASGNHISSNKLYDNDVDLAVFSNGTNDIKQNDCTTPSELCSL